MNAILSDVTVLELSHILAGPYCTMIPGDLGATVVKVERPDGGDDTWRFGPPYQGGESAYYLGLNRNKQGVTLDFNTPGGKEHLLKLARESTVLVENTIRIVGSPMHFSRTSPRLYKAPPMLGEDNAILSRLSAESEQEVEETYLPFYEWL